MKIWYTKSIFNQLINNLKTKINNYLINDKIRPPHLLIIYVGQNVASDKYINKKIEIAKKINLKITVEKINKNIKKNELIDKINFFQKQLNIDGIILQLPLTKKLKPYYLEIFESIKSNKDAESINHLNWNNEYKIKNCVVSAVIFLLKRFEKYHNNLKVGIINKSYLIGLPLKHYLKKDNFFVKLYDKNTNNIKAETRKNDILISATGVPYLIDQNWIKKNSILIDIGFSLNNENLIVGDFDPDKVKKIAFSLTPVPGGIGLLTVYFLLFNVFKLYESNYLKKNNVKL